MVGIKPIYLNIFTNNICLLTTVPRKNNSKYCTKLASELTTTAAAVARKVFMLSVLQFKLPPKGPNILLPISGEAKFGWM